MGYKLLVFLAAAAVLFSGCASHIEYVAEPERGIYADYIFLNNTRYIPLVKYCAYNDLDWRWDEIASIIEVSNGRSTAKFRHGSNIYLVDGASKYLEKPIELHKSTLYIPLDSAKHIATSVFSVEKIRATPGFHSIDSIIIDAGHGGKDPGAAVYGIKEKDIVLDIAKRLKENLRNSGIKVMMTRDGDTFIPLRRRAEIANTQNAKLFVSIHANASRASRASGFEVYHLSEATDDLARAVEAAENAAAEFEKDLAYEKSHNLNPTIWDIELSENRRESRLLAYYISDIARRELPLKDRGVRSAKFYVLKGTRMPAVLVEVGFITNRTELAKLKTSAYREDVARAIAKGILVYKKEFERTDGFTE